MRDTLKQMKMRLLTYPAVFGLGMIVMLGGDAWWHRYAPCHQLYDLLSPVRRCNDSLSQGEWNYEALRDELSAKKDELKAGGAVSHLSIYFQDLNHGPRFGIGEYDKFQPASLIKLPLLIFFLHAADLEPSVLDKQLSYSGQLNTEDNLEDPNETIQPDTFYSIRELLRKMIVYSDNRSYTLLLREMNTSSQTLAYYTFRDLDILDMMLETESTFVSISFYSKLFAILYNSSYLSKDMSQYALQLLSESTFKEGITKGVPDDQRVAHKFGYAVIDGEGQLHDCGVVYHPKMAYILCVMTSGADTNKANEAIGEISRLTYEAISELDTGRLQQDTVAR